MGFKFIDGLATPENIDKLLSLVDLVAGSNVNTQNVFDIEDIFTDSPQIQKSLQAVRQNPDSVRLLEERYIGPDFDLEALLQLPEGSLGWTYARVLSAMNYNPQFYRIREIQSDADYITHRVRKTHDLHHILTGFSFDDYGELGVISVTSAQIQYPAFQLLTLLGSFLSFALDLRMQGIDNQLEYNLDLVNQGISIARQAKPLFPVKFEEGLERPIDEWRAELNIIPVTAGVWSWYSRPNLRAAIAA
jgi:ubiquinone biosynthesis protein Coq4